MRMRQERKRGGGKEKSMHCDKAMMHLWAKPLV